MLWNAHKMQFGRLQFKIISHVARRQSVRLKEIFYLTTHSAHFIYGYMASDIWLRTILIVRQETRCRHIGYSFRLVARVLLYAPSYRQDSTYHGLWYTSRGALAERTIDAQTTLYRSQAIFLKLSTPTGLSVQDRRLVVSSNPVRG